MDLKQRRQVYSKIQAIRSMQAKEVFLKELATVGKKMDKQDAHIDFSERKRRGLSAVKRQKDPMKLDVSRVAE
jgi:hypothetical protein